MLRKKTTLIAIAALAAAGGFAAFRPDKLFVNDTVSEAAPAAGQSGTTTLAAGEFASYAHETVGRAEIIRTGDKSYLRLSGFSTSNGPDVRVLLVKGSDPKNTGAGQTLDLGTIKGNKGDQNYELPAGAETTYGAVNIWCARFSVGFGGAPLTPTKAASIKGFQLASYAAETVVTMGRLGTGRAALVEADGRRVLRLTGVRAKAGLRVLLLKSENPPAAGSVLKTIRLDLGALGAKGGEYAVPKDVDAWLYRSVILWDAAAKKLVAAGRLRSAQEGKSALDLTALFLA